MILYAFLLSLKLGELRATPDDMTVTLIDANGQTQTRSAKADSADLNLVRQLLVLTTSRADWDHELFSQRSIGSK